jgi:hypothetical protein
MKLLIILIIFNYFSVISSFKNIYYNCFTKCKKIYEPCYKKEGYEYGEDKIDKYTPYEITLCNYSNTACIMDC